jgi:DNA uptake protein ComE-like DNA-binding protein
MIFAGTAIAQVGKNTAVANPNITDESVLAGMTGLDETLASRIVAARPFGSTGELDELLGAALSDEGKTALHTGLFVPINLNTASREEIMLVPGISKKMAHEFEEYRPYHSIEQFRREIGKYVDDAEVARFEQYVFVPMRLNSASSEDFATIPGMSDRMVHEFEEYRPYTDMEQFRREIGKYVDEKEVARLERYLVID